ncbi:glycosyltransferase involved in cell wall biosynthesis [Arthrobacter sp. V4I6]|uniref:glycosyltransferase family 4 protein n=1 Tax=unclassified Arthrobacter TaxID=235627 RepID=UPI002780E6C0|nr:MULTISPECIES: glycosyltransferase family 4 protein [unclassified Arthrobacter]MDQ0822893.1 glycosyltransferase involved in cell wall biosynthesis [Arthrobacter sp. V1I7]MDQ0852522.1 glycosyltransferase involved in cell wall biosynthesis [Arthrobacter sp. V4I6]
MRIGLVAGPWIPVPPPAYGGTERVVDVLARGFVAAGHEVLLAAPSDSTCPVGRVPGMRVSEAAAMGTSFAELSHIIRAYGGLGKVDIVHDHTLAGPLYLHRPSSVPVVTTIHGPLNPSAVDIYRAIGGNASIIAISRDQVSHAPTVPVTQVIYHGLELSTVPVGKGQGGYACFVGRMCPDKGVTEAIAIAREAGVPLRIAAKIREPEEVCYYREVVKPILGANEEFIGELGDAEKYVLMGEALAFLNPIQWAEPFGLVMIEAMATGTPVVGTPVGSAPEIVDHGTTGFLAPVNELPALLPQAAALSRAACRATVETRFSSDRMVAEHLKLFVGILEGQLPTRVLDRLALHENQIQDPLTRGA